MEYKTNLIEFLSKEENNLLTTIVNCRSDLDAFSRIDGIFQAPFERIDVKATDNYSRMLVGLCASCG